MVLYARSDLAYLHCPAETGGCGVPHSRPVEQGAPAKLWILDCPLCEQVKRSQEDPHWSGTVSEIPETHDEKLAREDFEKRGAKDKDSILTLALAKLAGIPAEQLPDSLTQMVSGVRPHFPAAEVAVCPVGHKNAASQKYCGECGAPVGAPPAPVVADVQKALGEAERGETVDLGSFAQYAGDGSGSAPEAPQKPAKAALPSNTKMRSMKREELAQAATDAGLDASGTRADLLARLIKANNGGV